MFDEMTIKNAPKFALFLEYENPNFLKLFFRLLISLYFTFFPLMFERTTILILNLFVISFHQAKTSCFWRVWRWWYFLHPICIYSWDDQPSREQQQRKRTSKKAMGTHPWLRCLSRDSIHFQVEFFFTKLLTKKCKECLPVWAVLLLKFWTWTYVQSLLKLCRRTNKTETCGFVWSFYNWIVKQYVSFF